MKIPAYASLLALMVSARVAVATVILARANDTMHDSMPGGGHGRGGVPVATDTQPVGGGTTEGTSYDYTMGDLLWARGEKGNNNWGGNGHNDYHHDGHNGYSGNGGYPGHGNGNGGYGHHNGNGDHEYHRGEYNNGFGNDNDIERLRNAAFTPNGLGSGFGNDGGFGFGNGNFGYGNFYYEGESNNYNELQGLNALLGLERLKCAFYEHALERFSEQDFREAGFPNWVRGRYWQIFEHERIHVRFLEEIIGRGGADRVQGCQYRFNFENPWVFADQSEILETVVGSAYIGQIHRMRHHQEYSTVEASILAVDERHAAWIGSAVLGRNPWNTAFETPLTISQAYSALEEYLNVGSCPNSNHALLPSHHRIYPILRLPRFPIPGTEVEIFIDDNSVWKNDGENQYCYAAFLSGKHVFIVRVIRRDNGKYFIFIPRELEAVGTVYVIIIRGVSERLEEARIGDGNTLAGPAVIQFPFDSQGKPIRPEDGHGGNRKHHFW